MRILQKVNEKWNENIIYLGTKCPDPSDIGFFKLFFRNKCYEKAVNESQNFAPKCTHLLTPLSTDFLKDSHTNSLTFRFVLNLVCLVCFTVRVIAGEKSPELAKLQSWVYGSRSWLGTLPFIQVSLFPFTRMASHHELLWFLTHTLFPDYRYLFNSYTGEEGRTTPLILWMSSTGDGQRWFHTPASLSLGWDNSVSTSGTNFHLLAHAHGSNLLSTIPSLSFSLPHPALRAS